MKIIGIDPGLRCTGFGIVDSLMQYDWSPNNGLSNIDSSSTILEPTNSMYYYLLTTSSEGCKILDSIYVDIIGSAPVMNMIVSDDSICLGDTINIDALGEPANCGLNSSGCSGTPALVEATADKLFQAQLLPSSATSSISSCFGSRCTATNMYPHHLAIPLGFSTR